MVEAGEYDLVLMDVHMPRADGLDATRAIRALPPPKGRLPVVALTANAMHGDRERFLAAGMDDYLAKPVDRDRLGALLDAWARRLAGAWGGVAPTARASGPPPVPAAPDLPVVDRDVERDLRQDLGDATYERLVGSFAAGLAGALARLRAAVERGDTASALAGAHDLAGEAGNLGLARLAARLAGLERACGLGEAAARSSLALAEAAADEVLAAGAGTALEAA
jgi:CheY-like chemotaxis protein